jgi:FHA domain
MKHFLFARTKPSILSARLLSRVEGCDLCCVSRALRLRNAGFAQWFRTGALGIASLRVLALLLTCVSACVVFALITGSLSANAQSAGPFQLAVRCDEQDYPNVRCNASITDDRFGVTKPYTSGQLQFKVLDVSANKVLPATLVTPTQEESVSLLLVVDARTILDAPAPGTMLQTAKAVGDFLSLGQVTPADRVALIVPTANMSALPDFDDKVDSIFLAAPNVTVEQCPTYVQICNPLVQRARPAPIMPIYRALDRAVSRIKGQPGRRAIVLITDGRKANLQDLSQEIVLQRTNEAQVPIFVIGYGAKPNDALLRPLADLSGGELITATKVDELDERLAAIHRHLKTQYGLAFVAETPSDNQKHVFKIGVEVANVGAATNEQTLAAFLPVKPALVETLIAIGNQPAQSLDALLANQSVLGRQIELSPVVQVRGQVAHIEVRLNDNLLSDNVAPFKLSAKEMALADSVTHTLRIRALDAAGNASDEKRYDFRVEACPALCWVSENPTRAMTIAAIAAAALAVASLIGFAIARLAQARRGTTNVRPSMQAARNIATKPEPKTNPPASAFSNSNSNSNSNGTGPRITTIPNGTGAPLTAVPVRSRITKILDEQPLAFLEFASDNVSHKRVALGGHDGKSVIFGWDMREDDPENQVRIRSDYASRTHAEIRQQGDELYVIDLNSKSGTFLEGERLAANKATRIKPGDKLKFADTTATVKDV